MKKSLANAKHERFLQLLRKIRKEADLRQADVAQKLSQPQSFVSKYESGERRLDFLELEQVCEACGTDLERFLSLYRKFR
ncbi:MAG: helix-turn-helix domain-containing protein [Gammaproteobacteria bacterium]